ncbi:hypothetical protein VI817_000178 [Penicillium citrinum]|nr:hypothetical protein VI817_000178 [Penicillium citrinum]
MAGFGADLNQLEHHLMVQFSKLGEDIKVSVEKLKTIQTDLRSGQKELSRDLKASQQVLSTDVEWSRKELSTDLSSSRREITQDLDTRVTRLKNEVFGRENTFLTRALLTVSVLIPYFHIAKTAPDNA